MRRTLHAALLALIVGLVGCDHTTKKIAQIELRDQDQMTLISGVLDLTYAENTDIGFSGLRAIPYEIRWPLIIASGLIVISIFLFLWVRNRNGPWMEQVAFALILAGALGNQGDRLFRGYVIDFIHIHHWPIFNVADICITVGAIALGLVVLRKRKEPETPTPAET